MPRHYKRQKIERVHNANEMPLPMRGEHSDNILKMPMPDMAHHESRSKKKKAKY